LNTPICDFVENYIKKSPLRLHMPGHKGVSFLGSENRDITEIDGADSLYEAKGIISESEKNASLLFDCPTFYSTEGSSLCIRAMLYLAMLYAKDQNKAPLIAAARNAHKVFLSAAALLRFDIDWIYPSDNDSYLSCTIREDELESYFSAANPKPAAVYVTSPDYLGNTADIAALSRVCHRHGALLIVDNAHGAYLKFLQASHHPIDLGADLVCDSAHKTLPVLTGGAYLHVSANAPSFFNTSVKSALGLFGSTSPSYLILQSLDLANRYMADGYKERLAAFADSAEKLKASLKQNGFNFLGNEPLKITIDAKDYGYSGNNLACELMARNIIPEFYDPDFAVLMLTPDVGEDGLKALQAALLSIDKKETIQKKSPVITKPEKVMGVADAVFAASEELFVKDCLGRVLSQASVSCPPAVPIVVCGELIDKNAIECMEYYGIEKCVVVK